MPDGGAGFSVEDATFRPMTAAELLKMEIPLRRTLLMPWLPEKGAAMLYAPRGLGKTYLSLSVAYAVASGGICCAGRRLNLDRSCSWMVRCR